MKKRNYKLGIILVVVYGILVLGFLFLSNKGKGSTGYLILAEDSIYYKSNHKWKRYYKDISNPIPFTILTNSGLKTLEIATTKGKLEYYQNKSQINLEENFLFAYSKELNLQLKDYNLEPITALEIQKLDDILKDHDIIGYEYLSSNRLSYDFNRDGINETIYFVTNLFLETTYDKVFSFAYYIKNNQIVYLYEQVGSLDKVYDLCIPTVKLIADLDDNQNDELVLDCDYFDNIGVNHSFYQFENNEFVPMKGV